jgi:hypothetical protein
MRHMKLLLDVDQSRSLTEAERATGKTKEEILEVCLSTHLLKELGSSRLAAFLRANNFVEVEPDTALD